MARGGPFGSAFFRSVGNREEIIILAIIRIAALPWPVLFPAQPLTFDPAKQKARLNGPYEVDNGLSLRSTPAGRREIFLEASPAGSG